MNKCNLNGFLSIDISSSQDIFDILQRPDFKERFIFSKLILFDSEMVALFIDKTGSKYKFITNYCQMSRSNCQSIYKMDFFKWKNHFQLLANLFISQPINFWLSYWEILCAINYRFAQKNFIFIIWITFTKLFLWKFILVQS